MRQLGFLEWKDIDFEHSIINVNRSSLYLPEKGIFTDETKNNSSIRPVKVPDYVIQLLKKYRLQQKEQRLKLGDQRQDSGRILVQWNGVPIHPSTVTNWFHKFICNSDLPDIHLHSMRHPYVKPKTKIFEEIQRRINSAQSISLPAYKSLLSSTQSPPDCRDIC